MNKPLLLVITGSPASGKTTLANILAAKVCCPLISRDALKEGYVNTVDMPHDVLGMSADQHVYDTFFETIELLLSRGISIIAEAAFQHKLWQPKLQRLQEHANMRVLICNTQIELIRERFAKRLLQDGGRQKYHGDATLAESLEQFDALLENYEPIKTSAPALRVDTSNGYAPSVEDIINFIRQ